MRSVDTSKWSILGAKVVIFADRDFQTAHIRHGKILDSASFARARENVYGSLEILNSSFLVADNILADFDRAMEGLVPE